MPSNNRSKSLGYARITSLSGATSLTVPNGAVTAMISPETQAVRWRDDGVDPTASIGNLLYPGQTLTMDSDLTLARFIEATSGAVLNVAFYA